MSFRWMAAVVAAAAVIAGCDVDGGNEEPGNTAGDGGENPGGEGGVPPGGGEGGENPGGEGGEPPEGGGGGENPGGEGGEPPDGGAGGENPGGEGGEPPDGGAGGEGGEPPPPDECGDGEPDPGESCDDANELNGDGCDEWCRIELNSADQVVHLSGLHEHGDLTWARPDLDCESPMNGEYLLDRVRVVNNTGRSLSLSGAASFGHKGLFFGLTDVLNAEKPYGACVAAEEDFGRHELSVVNVWPGEEAMFIITSVHAGDVVGAWAVEIAASGCGDAVIHDGEQCDDGNLVSGDGCDAVCRWEPELEREVNDDLRWPDAIPTKGPVEGTLSASDVDNYMTIAFPGTTYTASIYRGEYGQCTDTSPRLELLDEDGNLLKEARATTGACAELDYTAAGQFPQVVVLRVKEGVNGPTAPLAPYFLHVTE